LTGLRYFAFITTLKDFLFGTKMLKINHRIYNKEKTSAIFYTPSVERDTKKKKKDILKYSWW
jgi:hypothetical protein